MSPVITFAFGKLLENEQIYFLLMSIPARISKPADCNPTDIPPHPQNKSTAVRRSGDVVLLIVCNYMLTSRLCYQSGRYWLAAFTPAPRTSSRISSAALPLASCNCTTWRPGQGSHLTSFPRPNSLPSISQRRRRPSALKLRRWCVGGMSGSSAMMVPDVGAVIRAA